MEKKSLYEVVILLSNHMNNYGQQQQLISEIFSKQCMGMWKGLSPNVGGVLQFISSFGLDQPPQDFFPLGTNDSSSTNRAHVSLLCIGWILTPSFRDHRFFLIITI
jgi:hypothetical protein